MRMEERRIESQERQQSPTAAAQTHALQIKPHNFLSIEVESRDVKKR